MKITNSFMYYLNGSKSDFLFLYNRAFYESGDDSIEGKKACHEIYKQYRLNNMEEWIKNEDLVYPLDMVIDASILYCKPASTEKVRRLYEAALDAELTIVNVREMTEAIMTKMIEVEELRGNNRHAPHFAN